MKFESSTLFVNTGRKPLPGMQKKKKNNKNNIVLGVCVAIILILCVFVGLIVHIWASYEDSKTAETTSVSREVKVKKPAEPPKTTPKPEDSSEKVKNNKAYSFSGKETDAVKAVNKEFASVDADYAYGVAELSGDEVYIMNTDKIENSAALAPYLAEYVSRAIYLGTFDYTTIVGEYSGSYLMDRAFGQGSVDAANMLISHFGADRLNTYFEGEGYANTHFAGTVGSDSGSYTTAEDLAKLMKKLYAKSGVFPYSDMYKKMRSNSQTHKIRASLPSVVGCANLSFTFGEESVDAAVVYTDKGNFVFVAMAEGSEAELEAAHKAMAASAKKICEKLK